MLPKLIITDIDGVWTDGSMYYDCTNNEFKRFNTADSAGVLWCKLNKIPVVIITGEDTPIVKRRADKLKIEYLYLGAKDKVALIADLLEKLNLQWKEIAFIGDDINDIALLEKAGFSATPVNAPKYVQKRANLTLDVKGGDGAFRAFVEYILIKNKLMEKTLSLYLEKNQTKFEQ